MPPQPLPKVVIAAGRYRLTVSVSQDLVGWVVGAALVGVREQVAHQGWRDGLPPYGLALLPQPHEALLDIKVAPTQGECATAPACGFDVQPEQQAIQLGVVAGGSGDLHDLRELGVW